MKGETILKPSGGNIFIFSQLDVQKSDREVDNRTTIKCKHSINVTLDNLF